MTVFPILISFSTSQAQLILPFSDVEVTQPFDIYSLVN